MTTALQVTASLDTDKTLIPSHLKLWLLYFHRREWHGVKAGKKLVGYIGDVTDTGLHLLVPVDRGSQRRLLNCSTRPNHPWRRR